MWNPSPSWSSPIKSESHLLVWLNTCYTTLSHRFMAGNHRDLQQDTQHMQDTADMADMVDMEQLLPWHWLLKVNFGCVPHAHLSSLWPTSFVLAFLPMRRKRLLCVPINSRFRHLNSPPLYPAPPQHVPNTCLLLQLCARSVYKDADAALQMSFGRCKVESLICCPTGQFNCQGSRPYFMGNSNKVL